MTEWLWVVPAVLAVVDWRAVARLDHRTETWAKPATLVAMIVVAWALGATDTAAGWWLLVALVFGLLGDVMLLGKSTARFQGGLAAFLVGHLAYVVSFVRLGLDRPAWALAGAVVVLASLVATRQVIPSVHRSDGPALSVPVAVYTLVISAMVLTAWMTGSWLVGAGATIFVSSDATLAVDRFVSAKSWARVAIMVTYHLGQALIVLGVLAAA